jgi:hypothetical protein
LLLSIVKLVKLIITTLSVETAAEPIHAQALPRHLTPLSQTQNISARGKFFPFPKSISSQSVNTLRNFSALPADKRVKARECS